MMEMKRILCIALLFCGWSCTSDLQDDIAVTVAVDREIFSAPDVVGSEVCVKLDRETADALSFGRTRSGELSTGNAGIDGLLSRYKVLAMERVFTPDHCEARMREAGLDLWYRIVIDEDMSNNADLALDLKACAGVDFVEPVRRVRRVGNSAVRYATQEELDAIFARSGATRSDASSTTAFNDPYYSEQWMLKNDGTVYSDAKIGADINVEEAWTMCHGNPDVIVAVVDDGVQYDHPDLAANIWEGIGRNFVKATSADGDMNIVGGDHGTHVAGTIAAVSNNNIGISGIAGGNGTPNSGVKIMVCQIMKGNSSATDIQVSNAIKFAANNGAVICQNSWGYDYSMVSNELQFSSRASYVREAIDYFVQYAGMSPDGKTQQGPVAGGVVLFAAGNDGADQSEYPAAYGKCLSVAAMSCSYRMAYYSTYNSTVDLTAPGGGGWDRKTEQAMWRVFKGLNLSTLPTSTANGNRDSDGYVVDYVYTTGYGWMEGTSMACPHASGVAALIASYCGGPGFTNENLKTILLESGRDISSYQSSTVYNGKIGKLVDAGAALKLGKASEEENPEEPVPPQVDFYPNPCTSRLNILFSRTSIYTPIGSGRIIMRDATGVRMLNKEVKFEYGKPVFLDVHNLAAGEYMLEVKYAYGKSVLSSTQRIIKK